LNLIDALALAVWLTGFTFEAGGDYQLGKFKSNPANQGRVLNTGFWRYTRHPNYFGDAAVWWGFGLFAVASGSWITTLGSILMTLLLVKVSGVAMLERSLRDRKPEYREYMRKTSSFFPWFPKD
jgi:steroid 5-alpha reductase family enzyme